MARSQLRVNRPSMTKPCRASSVRDMRAEGRQWSGALGDGVLFMVGTSDGWSGFDESGLARSACVSLFFIHVLWIYYRQHFSVEIIYHQDLGTVTPRLTRILTSLDPSQRHSAQCVCIQWYNSDMVCWNIICLYIHTIYIYV